SHGALHTVALRFADWLRSHPDVPLHDVCAAASLGRSHHDYRLALSGVDSPALVDALIAWAETNQHPACQGGQSLRDLSGRVAFLFTGQGSKYAGMAKHRYGACPFCRDALDRCDRIIQELGVGPLQEALNDPSRMDQADLAQPVLFAVEYALAQVWRHWGIEPAALLGHSVGEYIAACIAGVLTLEDGMRLIARRGQLMQACPEGAMLACFAPLEEVQSHVHRWSDRLE